MDPAKTAARVARYAFVAQGETQILITADRRQAKPQFPPAASPCSPQPRASKCLTATNRAPLFPLPVLARYADSIRGTLACPADAARCSNIELWLAPPVLMATAATPSTSTLSARSTASSRPASAPACGSSYAIPVPSPYPPLTGATVDVPREEGWRGLDGLEAPLGPLSACLRHGGEKKATNKRIFCTASALGCSILYICGHGKLRREATRSDPEQYPEILPYAEMQPLSSQAMRRRPFRTRHLHPVDWSFRILVLTTL